jgi:hypothetical protein
MLQGNKPITFSWHCFRPLSEAMPKSGMLTDPEKKRKILCRDELAFPYKLNPAPRLYRVSTR